MKRDSKIVQFNSIILKLTIVGFVVIALSNCSKDESVEPVTPSSPKTTIINNTNGTWSKFGENRVYQEGEKLNILFTNKTDKKFESGKLGLVKKAGDTVWVKSWATDKQQDIAVAINPREHFVIGKDITTAKVVIKNNTNSVVTKKAIPVFHNNKHLQAIQTTGTLNF